MTLEQIGILFSIITAIASVLSVLVIHITKLATLELKVNTLWDYLMRTAFGEATDRGVGTMNSPFLINDDVLHWFDYMKSDLKRVYRECQYKKFSEREMIIEIERQLGERIMKEVCMPRKVYHGAALLIAAAVAKDCKKIDLKSDLIYKE